MKCAYFLLVLHTYFSKNHWTNKIIISNHQMTFLAYIAIHFMIWGWFFITIQDIIYDINFNICLVFCLVFIWKVQYNPEEQSVLSQLKNFALIKKNIGLTAMVWSDDFYYNASNWLMWIISHNYIITVLLALPRTYHTYQFGDTKGSNSFTTSHYIVVRVWYLNFLSCWLLKFILIFLILTLLFHYYFCLYK